MLPAGSQLRPLGSGDALRPHSEWQGFLSREGRWHRLRVTGPWATGGTADGLVMGPGAGFPNDFIRLEDDVSRRN